MTHPYRGILPQQHWMKAIAGTDPDAIDPMVEPRFQVGRADRVATAGSCFAQHIARHLAGAGFDYMVTETPHPAFARFISSKVAAEHNYGVFTARYGNVYTPRQLLQLFQRAYGEFSPREQVWTAPESFGPGRVVDPFRPQIQPGGFHSADELFYDREGHLAAVREAFEGCDVLVFTLGLTETYVSREDGAAYPVAPGVSGGDYDPSRHAFLNLTAAQALADMQAFRERLKSVNPGARMILTVSPVPLMATAERRHVLVSTTLSKSVLRVVCDEMERAHDDVVYFPSYEIITGGFSRGAYYAEDLREVREEGVAHVMRIFMRHMAEGGGEIAAEARPAGAGKGQGRGPGKGPGKGRKKPGLNLARAADLVCEEEALRDL